VLNAGDCFQHYEIARLLGRGGMGEVYLARDTVLERHVALKFLPEELENDPRMRERFLREARSAAALDHPFICKIYETGVVQGKAFIAMEYVDGETLKDRMAREHIPLRDTIRITLEIGEALENAHKAGIVHRDLKPSNIMLSAQGHTKVMDFGLAKHVVPGTDASGLSRTMTQESLTERGAIAGTIAYMSPEQAKGGAIDGRSDIFSLGIILYEMLTGANPFSKPTPIETLTSILRDAAPATHVTPKSVNPLLNPIVHKALAKDPAERYLKVEDLVADLERAYREVGGGPLFSRRAIVIGGTVLAVAMLAFVVDRLVRKPAAPAETQGPKMVSVLIADAANKTGEAVFDGVLEKLLTITLAGSPYISVYDSKQARQQALLLKPASEGRVDPETAQLLSRRQGIDTVIDLGIEKAGPGYKVRASAWDVAKSRKISEIDQTVKEKGDVLKIADVIAAKLSRDLGAIPAESREALVKETFTTSSLEAMHAYAAAQDLSDLGRPDEAIKLLHKALDYDPNFGRAYAILAVVYLNRQQYQEARTYIQEALKRIDQMTDREKYRTRGINAFISRNFRKAIEEYSALLTQYPGDYVPHANLALAYFLARNMPKALEEERIDIQHDPQSATSHYNMSWYALAAGDFAAADREARAVLALEADYEEAYVPLALAQLARGSAEQAAETYHKLSGLGPYGHSAAATGLADIAAYEGRLRDAAAILTAGIASDLGGGWSDNAADKDLMLAQVRLDQGERGEALRLVEGALKINQNSEVVYCAAQILLAAGFNDRVRALAAELDKRIEPEPRAYVKLLGGQMSLSRGDKANAIKILQEAQDDVDTWLGRLLLGRAYLEAAAYPEAHSEFELCLKRRGEAASVFINDLPTYRYFPAVYYYMGRAQEGLGSAAAAESYRTFLKIKDKADPGDRLTADARNRLLSR
jgi:tetratricopeptide (TPR) repeat protein/tRNA A-37 threonylcarbamoyl transferase component Bud32